MKTSETAAAVLTWLAIGVIAAAGIRSWDPPTPAGRDASPHDFSAMRSMEHVRAIAARPHPIGTAGTLATTIEA